MTTYESPDHQELSRFTLDLSGKRYFIEESGLEVPSSMPYSEKNIMLWLNMAKLNSVVDCDQLQNDIARYQEFFSAYSILKSQAGKVSKR